MKYLNNKYNTLWLPLLWKGRGERFILLSLLLVLFAGGSIVAQIETDVTDEIDKGDKIDKSIAVFGYNDATKPEWMVTRSKSTITGDQTGNSVMTNFGNRLPGRLSGLTVQTGGNESGYDSPGLYSRGRGSLNPNGVLVIVDGFECFYEQLIPEEIESLTLLKDAAATALYGMKGANGVLLITTKRGKDGPLNINFSAQTGFETPYRMPDFLGSYDYARLYNEALENDGRSISMNGYSDADLEAYRTGSDPYFYPDVNWHDELFRKLMPVSKYSLSFSEGRNRVRYLVLLGGMHRGGLYKKTEDLSEFSVNSTFVRYNIRSNVDIDVTKRLTASVNIGYTLANKENPVALSSNGMLSWLSLLPPNAFPVYNPNGSYGGTSLLSNPYGDVLETGMYSYNHRTAQTSLKLTNQLDMIAEGLSVSVAASFNSSFQGATSKSRNYDRYAISKNSSGDIVYRKFGEPSSLEVKEDNSLYWKNVGLNSSLNYQWDTGEHYIDAALGYDLTSNTVQSQITDFRHLGFNGRVAYAWQKKYIGELTAGYYGGNGYPKGARFGWFPGVSAGWIVSNEDFLKGNKMIDFLKVKASFGITGNNFLPNNIRFIYDRYYGRSGSYIYGTGVASVTGYAESLLPNPDLTWEKKKEWNIGFDAKLMNGIDIRLDMFWENRYHILLEPENIPGFAGITSVTVPLMNTGEVTNKGFETQIGYRSNLSGDFNFMVNLDVWYARNKIIYNAEAYKEYDYLRREGRPVGQPFLLEAVGFFKDEDDVNQHAQQAFGAVQPGDVKYKDQNGDGIVNSQDIYPMGYSSLPEITFGLNTGFVFRNFYLNAFFQAVTHRSVLLSGSDFFAFQNDGKISSIALDRWTEATGASATYPRLSSQANQNNYRSSSLWLRNGSFVKMRDVELGYRLPKSLVAKAGISDAAIFLNGANLFTLDHVKIADPEIISGYPATRAFTVGVKIQL